MKKDEQTHAKQEPLNWEALKAKVMELTGMDELEYAQVVYESGLAYLGLYWRNDESWTNRWSSSRIFWVWWRNQWALKDGVLLPMLQELVDRCLINGEPVLPYMIREVYLDEHSGQQALKEFKPNPVITKAILKQEKP